MTVVVAGLAFNGKESYHQKSTELRDKKALNLLLPGNIGTPSSKERMFVVVVVPSFLHRTPSMTVVVAGLAFIDLSMQARLMNRKTQPMV